MQERQPLKRRYDRNYVMLPVNLVATSSVGVIEQLGSIVDLSKGGLRVQTCRSLTQGQRLKIFLRGVSKPYASCRVVWSRTQGSALPSEAGLEILREAPSGGDSDADFLAELREVYHNPATSR